MDHGSKREIHDACLLFPFVHEGDGNPCDAIHRMPIHGSAKILHASLQMAIHNRLLLLLVLSSPGAF